MTLRRRLTPDLRLVSACLAWPPSDVRTAAISAAALDPALEWRRVLAAIARRGSGRAAGQALLLMEVFFGRRLPAALERRVHGDWKVRELTTVAAQVLVDPREPEAVPFRSTTAGPSVSRKSAPRGWAGPSSHG